jgi:hypothetical protein
MGGAERHLGIAREIEIQLEFKRDRRLPGEKEIERLAGRCRLVGGRYQRPEMVSQDHLFEQPDHEDRHAEREVARLDRERPGPFDLGKDLAVMGDRAGQQLREEHHEKAVFEKIVLLDLAAAGIDQIGDLLKREEGDPERQQDVLQHEIGLEQLVGRLDEEIGVLEVPEHREVDDNPERQQHRHPIAAAHLPVGGEPARDQKIKQREA